MSPGGRDAFDAHTDLRFTLEVYTDPAILQTAAEVAKLPRLSAMSDADDDRVKGVGEVT